MDYIKINNHDKGGSDAVRFPRSSLYRRRPRPRFQNGLIFLSSCAALLSAIFILLRPQQHVSGPTTYSPEAEHACRDIHATLLAQGGQDQHLQQQQTYFPGDAAYEAELNHYWSTPLAELRPACVVQPTTASQVAAVVRVLRKDDHATVPFAVKSGGHDPNPGHASVDGGVLIALRHMKGVRYDAERDVAYVKPGGEWNDVMGALEPHGVTIVGGRLGLVGVGGYLLQGGLSFLSAQHGLAADSIVEWETVTANGTIVNITQETHPDLAVAMRGGGNQFGIVTRFTVKTRPLGKVWGGVRIYRGSRWDQLQAALHDFTLTGAEDPKAAIIFADFFMYKRLGTYVIYFFYDGEKPPTAGPFADLLKIPAMVDRTSTKTYSSMLWANGFLAGYIRGRTFFRTFTLPAIASNPRIYDEIATQWRGTMQGGYLNRLRNFPSQCSIEFQPLPAAVGAQSERAGGNAMGLRGSDPNRIVLNLQCMWLRGGDDDATMRGLAADMTRWLERQLPAWNKEAGAVENGGGGGGGNMYMPLFMNDAMSDQNVMGSYRGYEKFRELQRSVDPEGMFRRRVGGHKY